ncbi:hypothetical protein ACFTAO_02085 [Paenibacillus rhizoplanae]
MREPYGMHSCICRFTAKRLEDSSIGYRIEASNMHLPALLMLFMPFY